MIDEDINAAQTLSMIADSHCYSLRLFFPTSLSFHSFSFVRTQTNGFIATEILPYDREWQGGFGGGLDWFCFYQRFYPLFRLSEERLGVGNWRELG